MTNGIKTRATYSDDAAVLYTVMPADGTGEPLSISLARDVDGVWRASVFTRFGGHEVGAYMGPHFADVRDEACKGAASWYRKRAKA